MLSFNLTGFFCRVRHGIASMFLIDLPLIINWEKILQGKIETIRNCVYMNKRIFSLFIAETINSCIIV